MTLVVSATGPLALIQDLGRPGHARSGVPASGAYDRFALRLANALVGNSARAPAVECLLGGMHLTATQACTVAVTGAGVTLDVVVGPLPPLPATETDTQSPDQDTRSERMHEAIRLEPSMRLRLGRPRDGLRTYVAVSGGFDFPPVLGSASTDTLSGLGPARLVGGVRLEIGSQISQESQQWVELSRSEAGESHPISKRHDDPTDNQPIRVSFGPFDDLTSAAVAGFLNENGWRVSPNSDRVGLRLQPAGHEMAGRLQDELQRELQPVRRRGPTPMFRGVIQIPPSGELIIMGPDAPTTGGYPIIGVVADADLDRLAQLRPGRSVRLAVS